MRTSKKPLSKEINQENKVVAVTSPSEHSRSAILIGCSAKVTEPANLTLGYRLSIEMVSKGGVVFYPRLDIVRLNDLH